MRHAYVDFETYYSTEYSLSRMTPAEYVLDQRFEELGAAVAYNDEPGVWLEDEALAAWLTSTMDEPTIIFSHNALFDAVIMAWHFKVNPTLWGDTLGMSRGVLNGVLKRFSLKAVSEHLELGVKGDTVVSLKGYNKAALRANPTLHAECKAYAVQDMNLCRKIERALAPSFPVNEYLVVDTLIRAVTEPYFSLDFFVVYQHMAEVRARKAELLAAVEMDTPLELMSNQKFADALEALGVEPPLKISKTTGKETFAFAKTDLAMAELSEHENPKVQALVAARLGHKSTQEETRSQRFIDVATACSGYMVIPLKYSGAHTHRFSGDWKMNVQNLGRGSPLRRALKAPVGYKVVAVDASQIEARLGAWLAKWTWLLDQFRDPTQDPYSNYATMLFGVPVTKANKMERFVGKQSILSLQYGASWKAFQRMCRVMGGMIITEEEARKYVSDYRRIAKPITDYWKSSSRFIEAMANGNMVSHKSIFTSKEKIHLPSGLCLRYPELWYEKVARSEVADPANDKKFSGWRYGDGIGLFGGKLMENECQALARIIVTDAGTRVRRQHKISYKLQVHDELVYVVPEEQAAWLREVVVRELSTPPSWAPDIPLAAEGGIGDNYGDVK